ncbi:MAG: hypothetical protein ACOCP8_01845 [archaeon]
MKTNIEYNNKHNAYYFTIDNIDYDISLANLINMPHERYLINMVNKFNAIVVNFNIYFKNKIDANNALEWYISQLTINKLVGE